MEQDSIGTADTGIRNLANLASLANVDSLASSPRWDVIIIGGGLAGLISAIILSRHGKSVLVVERKEYPRDKVCGACLNANALASLKHLGLMALLDEANAPTLSQVNIFCGSQKLSMPLPAGRAVTRSLLDYLLASEAQKSGAQILQNASASLESLASDTSTRSVRIQTTSDTFTCDAKVVMIAAGLSGVKIESRPWRSSIKPRSKIGIGCVIQADRSNLEAHNIYMCVRQHGYLGMVKAEHGLLNLAAAIEPGILKTPGGISTWISETLHHYGLELETEIDPNQWIGTPALTRRVEKPFGPRWVAIGDSVGYVEPFTGEGMAWAIAGSAQAAFHVLAEIDQWSEKSETQWGILHRKLIHDRQLGCKWLAWTLNSSFRSHCALRLASYLPPLATWFVRSINRESTVA